MKPRIRMNAFGQWECVGDGVEMCGVTPQDAFQLWALLRLFASGQMGRSVAEMLARKREQR